VATGCFVQGCARVDQYRAASGAEDSELAWLPTRPDSDAKAFEARVKLLHFPNTACNHKHVKDDHGDSVHTQDVTICDEETTVLLRPDSAVTSRPDSTSGRVMARIKCGTHAHGVHDFGCIDGDADTSLVTVYTWLSTPSSSYNTWRVYVFRDSLGIIRPVAETPFVFWPDTAGGVAAAEWNKHPDGYAPPGTLKSDTTGIAPFGSGKGGSDRMVARVNSAWVACGTGCCSE
jgi:hypothetical protein